MDYGDDHCVRSFLIIFLLLSIINSWFTGAPYAWPRQVRDCLRSPCCGLRELRRNTATERTKDYDLISDLSRRKQKLSVTYILWLPATAEGRFLGNIFHIYKINDLALGCTDLRIASFDGGPAIGMESPVASVTYSSRHSCWGDQHKPVLDYVEMEERKWKARE